MLMIVSDQVRGVEFDMFLYKFITTTLIITIKTSGTLGGGGGD